MFFFKKEPKDMEMLLPKEYNKSICEVRSLTNTLLATGIVRLVANSGDTLEIMSRSGYLPMLPMSTRVNVVVHNSQAGPKVLTGEVYISSEDMMRLRNVTARAEHDPRRYYRQTIDHSAFLLFPPGATDRAGAALAQRIPIRVKDISQCGLMFECENTFAVGDELQINMTLLHNELEVLHLIIRREVERPAGKKGYGCDIVDMSPRVEQRLTAFVMEEQQQSLRRSRR